MTDMTYYDCSFDCDIAYFPFFDCEMTGKLMWDYWEITERLLWDDCEMTGRWLGDDCQLTKRSQWFLWEQYNLKC